MQTSKPENTRNELGAAALCVSSMVAFLSAAAFAKSGFSFIEWWLFVLIGGGWISWYASNFFILHNLRLQQAEHLNLLAEQNIIIDNYRSLIDKQQKVVAAQKACVTPKYPPADQRGNTETEDKKDDFAI